MTHPGTSQDVATSRARRALRILADAFTALSFVLALGAVALGARSYRVCDIVGFGRDGGNCHLVQSILGRIHLLSDLDGGCTGGFTYRADRFSSGATWDGRMSGYPTHPEWRLGFIWQTYTYSGFGLGQSYSMTERLIVVPYWFLVAVFALAPLIWIMRRRPVRLRSAIVLVAAIAIVLACLRPPPPTL